MARQPLFNPPIGTTGNFMAMAGQSCYIEPWNVNVVGPMLPVAYLGGSRVMDASGRSISVREYGPPNGEFHVMPVTVLAWHPDQPNLLAFGSSDGTVKVWNLDTLRAVTSFVPHSHTGPPQSLTGRHHQVTLVKWSPTAPTCLLTGGTDSRSPAAPMSASGRIVVLDLRNTAEPVQSLAAHGNGDDDEATCISLSPSAKKPRAKKPAASSSNTASSSSSAAAVRATQQLMSPARREEVFDEVTDQLRQSDYGLSLLVDHARKVMEARANGADSDEDDEAIVPPSQELKDMASMLFATNPEMYDSMRKMGLPLPAPRAEWAAPGGSGGRSSAASGASSGFPAGFSDLHLEKAVAAIGGTQNLHTPKASVSIAVGEIKVTPLLEFTASGEEKITGYEEGDSGDEEAPGLASRAVVFHMWCHETRVAHPLCFYMYNSVRPHLVAGRINKVVSKLQRKGFTVVSWFSDCNSTYHEINELVSTNPSINWIPDPVSVLKGLRDALADPNLTLDMHTGGVASIHCVANLVAIIKREPRLAKLYNITPEYIQLKTDGCLMLNTTLTDLTPHTANALRLMFIVPLDKILASGGSLTASTRAQLQDALASVKSTLFYMSAMIKYRAAFLSRERIANLNHSVLTELDDVAEYFVAWQKHLDARATRTTGSAAAREAFKAKSFIPMTTYSALLDSMDGFKLAARRLVQTDVKPVVPVAFGNKFVNDFLAEVRAAGVPRVQAKHIIAQALKTHQQNAMLMRATANMRRTPEYYDGPDDDGETWRAPAELVFGSDNRDEGLDENGEGIDQDGFLHYDFFGHAAEHGH
ncbi:rRNA-processing protein [Blastocladiella emersonii ATCC 22665]|nr:rRNA-processing protein [Blastocladiella emersonii ATCC 22665]